MDHPVVLLQREQCVVAMPLGAASVWQPSATTVNNSSENFLHFYYILLRWLLLLFSDSYKCTLDYYLLPMWQQQQE